MVSLGAQTLAGSGESCVSIPTCVYSCEVCRGVSTVVRGCLGADSVPNTFLCSTPRVLHAPNPVGGRRPCGEWGVGTLTVPLWTLGGTYKSVTRTKYR